LKNTTEFSLLSHCGSADKYFPLGKNAVNDLSLNFLAEVMAEDSDEISVLTEMLSHVPSDSETIKYRQEIYRDLCGRPDVCREFYEIFDELKFYSMDRRTVSEKHSNIWELINRLSAVRSYVNSVTGLQKILKSSSFQSAGMKNLAEYIDRIYNDSGFSMLEKDLECIGDDALGIHSMTLGVNFNEDFYPEEIGIISLNRNVIYEKGVIERFMSFHRKRTGNQSINGFSMISHNSRVSASDSPLMKNLTSVVEQMLPGQVKKIGKILKKYTDISGVQLARCADELLFYLRMISFEKKLNESGFKTCIPEISDDGSVFRDLYSVKLAACVMRKEAEGPVVTNDLEFVPGREVLLLTGPNRGGKTILTQAAGLAFLFFQHGMFVPGSSAKLRVCDGIFTHFPADENQTVSLGRLGEEAERFSTICRNATSESLVLMNESFATTSHMESLYIAEDAVKYLCSKGIRTFFNTHMHELGENAENYHEDGFAGGAVSVVMGRRDSENAFKIKYEKPDGKSFAREIAEKYGITFEQLSAGNTSHVIQKN